MFIRSNKDSFEGFYNEAYQIAEELNNTIGIVTSFLGTVPGMIPNTDYEEKYDDVDSEGIPYTRIEVVERWKEEKSTFRSLCNASNFGKCTPLSKASEKVKKMALALESIYKLIINFEEDELQNVSLKDAFSNIDNVSVTEVNGVEVVYYDLDGEKFTIAELTNAFYTYSGMAMDTMIQGSLQSDDFKTNIGKQQQLLEGVNSFVGSALSSSAFGIASKEDILNTANDLGVSADFRSAESILVSNSGTDLNSYITSEAAVAGFALLAAYALTDNLPLKEEQIREEEIVQNPSTSTSQEQRPVLESSPSSQESFSTGGQSPVNNPIHAQEESTMQKQEENSSSTLEQPSSTETPSSLVEMTTEEIPETVSFGEEKDYDELALEEFESLDFDEVTERTNRVVEEALTLFEAEDKTLLKDKLATFGYSEPEIMEMIENRDYVVTAFIEGDRRQQLGEIANRLADQDGILNFDTSYDDGQQYKDLTNGTSSKFIIDMGSDPTVSKSRTEYWEARTTYQTKMQEANESIANATRIKQDLTNVQKEIGSDQSHWTKEQRERYNTLVTKYNDAVYDSKQKVSSTNQAKETYFSKKNSYTSAKEAYLKKIRGETNERMVSNENYETLKENEDSFNQGDVIHFSDADVLQSVQN